LTKAVDYLASLQDEKTKAWPWLRARVQSESPWRTLAQDIEEFSSQSVSLLVLSEAALDLDSDALAWEEENKHMLEQLELDALRLMKQWTESANVTEPTASGDRESITLSAMDKAAVTVAKVELPLQQLQTEVSTFKEEVYSQFEETSN
jgi:hypothetical protein